MAAGNDGLLGTYYIVRDSKDYKKYKNLGYYRGTFYMYKLTNGHIFYKPADTKKFPKEYQEKYADLFEQVPAGFYLFENLGYGQYRGYLEKY